jgi:hypothetical protein
MTRSPAKRRRWFTVSLTTVFVALGASTLMAPSCGEPGEGEKTFSKGSIIIPMDVCYQRQTDGTGATYNPASCPQAADAGDVIRAYGLVYQLIRNDVAVYWIIDNEKTQIDGVDLTVQYAGGFPVLFYDWTPENPPPASPPTAQHAIDYRGGPFVVDGSDFARASQVLQSFRSTFQNVNVHVSNVAFQAYAKRTMAGGWSAGGTVAPKVALLDIGSTSSTGSGGYAKNSEPIIRGYLARAGLDFPGAGGVATDSGHGQIYDRLGMADLQPSPSSPGDWTTTNLYKYGYQILWVPHWFAPGSCANASSQTACVNSLYPLAQRDQALKTVGAFVAGGKDLFAECAGLGSFEGVATSGGGWSNEYSDGDATTHFHATNGLAINKSVGTALYDLSSASSPLLQLGDYPFIPRSGAIQNFKPAPSRSSAYTAVPPAPGGVSRLVRDVTDSTWDYFTYRPPADGVRGTTVYLGGHVYSGYSDTLNADGTLRTDASSFAIGGTRLVLNTLFNLGATCTASGVACNTGQPGQCAPGRLTCDPDTGQPVCTPLPTSVATAETCNGLDDDCDWEVDEDLEAECYDLGMGDASLNRGVCRSGVRSCTRNPDGSYAMSACVGQVLPSAEVCNALDDDCDNSTDEGLVQACYEGPSSSIDPSTGQPRPVCQAGSQTCNLGSWGACNGQRLPKPEVCTEGAGGAVDEDCNGTIDEGCTCLTGQTRPCYTGPAGTAGVGLCVAGTQSCTAGTWSACIGEVLPAEESCGNGVDENCDTVDPACPECLTGIDPARACYPNGGTGSSDLAPPPPGQTKQCKAGTEACVANAWDACVGAVLPSPIEACDAIDNDCDGVTDEGAVCPSGQTCLRGVCVPSSCGIEMPAPEGYACSNPTGGVIVSAACGDTASPGCPPGQRCRYGACEVACTDLDADGLSDQCGAGSICAGGGCVAGGCYATGCLQGELCRNGGCVDDPCAGRICPAGTFCREGDCIQACAFVSCTVGAKCGMDGFCEADPCAGVTCAPGQRCRNGSCGADPCTGLGCAGGQMCTVDSDGAAVCVDDPCTGITCPTGVCSGGQCFSTANPTGAGVTPGAPESKGGCGCGSGGGAALPALLLLLAAPLARRRSARGGVALLLVSVALVASACKEEATEFDPATCQETCGEPRCVDVTSDASHCGACGSPCGVGFLCVDEVCGAAVAPRLASISPGSGARGSLVPVTVQLSGERFASGAVVRLFSGSTTREFPTTFVNAGRLSAELDLADSAADAWKLRVVNPDHVISNAVPFDVVVPYPSITGVTPAVVTAGNATTVLVTGTQLTATSQCRIRSGSLGETGLASTVDVDGVHCELEAGLSPGTYDLWVVNEGNLASNVRQVQVVSATAQLQAVSPSSGPENLPVSLTVTGTGFDAATRVLFDDCIGPSNPAGPDCVGDRPIVATTFVNPTTLVAALALPDCGATSCGHTISVRTGTGATTPTLPFAVAADQPTVSTFSPATAYQGDGCAQAGCAPVTLTFTGSSFPNPNALIQVQKPGGTFGTAGVTTTTSTSNTVAATMSLVGQPEGAWLARIDFGAGLYSAAWPFRVLSNQAILRDVQAAPVPERSGAAGTTKTTVTLQGANLRPPYAQVRVAFVDPSGAATVLVPSSPPTAATSSLTVSNLSLANRDTGLYAFKIRNPNGAADSNALSFTVTPGMPSVGSVCRLEGSACAATNPTRAVQQSTPVPVRITGTNFAKPDASGNGSMVMVTSSIMPGWPTMCPAAPATPPFVPVPGTVEVKSSTEIVVQLDTLAALALPGGTTYYIAVWNPGGSPSPQKSNGCTTPTASFTIAP